MEQFWALCSISHLSSSSSLFSRTLYQTWLPFKRRPAVPTTPRHKYPFSPEHFPSPCLTFFLSSLSPNVFLSLTFPFCTLSHSHFSPTCSCRDLPFALFGSVSLCLSSFSQCKISLRQSSPLVLNWAHLHSPLSSIAPSSQRFSFDFQLFTYLAKLNNNSKLFWKFSLLNGGTMTISTTRLDDRVAIQNQTMILCHAV